MTGHAKRAHVYIAIQHALCALCCCPQTVTTQAVEALIKDRLARGGHISFQRLMDETVARGFSRAAVGAAVRVMELRGELKRKAEGKLLQRTQR